MNLQESKWCYYGTYCRSQANKHACITSVEMKKYWSPCKFYFLFWTDSNEAGGQKRERPAEKKSWIDSLRYPWLLIGLLATVIITVITFPAWFCWRLKKTRASSPPAIASLRPRYDARNEYVVVPDFKWNQLIMKIHMCSSGQRFLRHCASRNILVESWNTWSSRTYFR